MIVSGSYSGGARDGHHTSQIQVSLVHQRLLGRLDQFLQPFVFDVRGRPFGDLVPRQILTKLHGARLSRRQCFDSRVVVGVKDSGRVAQSLAEVGEVRRVEVQLGGAHRQIKGGDSRAMMQQSPVVNTGISMASKALKTGAKETATRSHECAGERCETTYYGPTCEVHVPGICNSASCRG